MSWCGCGGRARTAELPSANMRLREKNMAKWLSDSQGVLH